MAKSFEMFEFEALKKNKTLNSQKKQLKAELELETERNISEVLFVFVHSILRRSNDEVRKQAIKHGLEGVKSFKEERLNDQRKIITSSETTDKEKFEAFRFLKYLEDTKRNTSELVDDAFKILSKRLDGIADTERAEDLDEKTLKLIPEEEEEPLEENKYPQ